MNTHSARDAFGSFLEKVSRQAAGESVPVTTLDLYCRRCGIQPIDLSKIDAEGHEPWVLECARELLDGNRIGMMILETDPEHLSLYTALSTRGFHFFCYNMAVPELNPIRPLTRESLEHMKPTAFSSNIVLIDDDRLPEVKTCLKVKEATGQSES